MDFTPITERIYTGAGIETGIDVDALAAAGVTAVVDARAEFDDLAIIMASHPRFLYLWDPAIDDGIHPKSVTWFQRAIDFAMPIIARPGGIIYFHCAAGINRGPSLTYAMLRALGWSKTDAMAVLKAKRPQVQVAYAEDAELALTTLGWTK